MSFGPREYLRHILAEADYLLSASVGLERDAYMANETLRRAFVRALEVMGEAAKQVPATYRAAHPEVPWRAMAGLRDRLAHGYFAMDHDLIWQMVRERVPDLRRDVAALLAIEAVEGT